MGPNSGLFKCNPPDYIEKEDLVKRDLFALPFFEAGSRGYSVGSYFCPAIACQSSENCWTIVVFLSIPPPLHELPPLASVGGQVITSHLQGALFDFGSQRPSCAPS